MRVWFNHWFSTAYYFVKSVKEDNFIITSNRYEDYTYKCLSDESYVEPAEDIDYVNWCLDFCAEHHVDVFFPKRGMLDIIKNKCAFDELNVKVVCETNYEYAELLSSKIRTANLFSAYNLCKVPEYGVFNNAEEFEYLYKYFKAKYGDVCIKYNIDEGAQSFKHIVDKEPSLSRLSESSSSRISFEYASACMGDNYFKDMLIMPYIKGTEISVDCLYLANKLITVSRSKLIRRSVQLEYNLELESICNKFVDILPLDAPFNIQFFYCDGEYYLLEVNTRLSGGAWKDKALGVDFAKLAFDNLVKTTVAIPTLKDNKVVMNLEGLIDNDSNTF